MEFIKELKLKPNKGIDIRIPNMVKNNMLIRITKKDMTSFVPKEEFLKSPESIDLV
jgi:hypothetical protein